MTLSQAKADLKDIDTLCSAICLWCKNEWYCPTDCDTLLKAKAMDFDKIIKSYARNDGDLSKVIRYIKRTNNS